MSGCMIVCRSVTYAQRARQILEKHGIHAVVVRPRLELTENSCGFAVKVSEGYLAEALELLREFGFTISRVLLLDENGNEREMRA